jgi:anthranilate synthase component 1
MSSDRDTFSRLASRGGNLVPLARRILSDQITPVLAYRRLVSADDRTAPSFLFESVETGGRLGRYSMLGAQPALELVGRGQSLVLRDGRSGRETPIAGADPLAVPAAMSKEWRVAPADPESKLPQAFCGGWVGYASYDTVRCVEPEKLPFSSAPRDDRGLPDMHFGLYREVVVFDHVEKIAHAVVHVALDEHASTSRAFDAGRERLDALVARLEAHSVPLPSGRVELNLAARPASPGTSNFPAGGFEAAVARAKEYIAAGDAFQVVLSQRFERRTHADPFEIYRALRVVNPSPYQIYLQAEGCILVAASPEILCRVHDGVVTNRPLAGTRRRGADPDEDAALEVELRADQKECAEHVMLVDLGRNDLGRVCDTGSIRIERCMEVERYSHVMHLSSTLTGRLRAGLDCWDALKATLPVGTVSGAPKVRAMQIIDELEPTRRGPYAGGIGAVGFDGQMDIAIALRTLVVPTALRGADGAWTVHLQAGAGIVADSVPASEREETVSKAAALGRAIDLAESAFRT